MECDNVGAKSPHDIFHLWNRKLYTIFVTFNLTEADISYWEEKTVWDYENPIMHKKSKEQQQDYWHSISSRTTGLLHHRLCKWSHLCRKKTSHRFTLNINSLTFPVPNSLEKHSHLLLLNNLAATPLSPSPTSALATKIDEDQRPATPAGKQKTHNKEETEHSNSKIMFSSSETQGLAFFRLMWLVPLSARSHLLFCSEQKPSNIHAGMHQ